MLQRSLLAGIGLALSVVLTPVHAADPRESVERVLAAGVMAEADQADLLRRYAERDFTPLWLRDGQPGATAKALIEAIAGARQHGLNPADYWLEPLRRAVASARHGDPMALDAALSIAALRWGQDMQGGRPAAIALPADYRLPRRAATNDALLDAALRPDLVEMVDGLDAGRDPVSLALREALLAHRAMASSGGWPRIAGGAILEPGASDARVPALRKRLAATDGAPAETEADDPNLFDPALVASVRRFQARHGLPADGRVGRVTLAALNVTIGERIAQIEINLDRARLQASRRMAAGPQIVVNIPEQRLQVIEGDVVHLEMKVIVGRPDRPTPILSSRVNEVVFNPSWTVPHKLARFDLLPRLRADPALVARQGFRVYKGSYEAPTEIDPREVNWRNVKPGAFYYWLRQDPGPGNALGQVRLSFPNTFDVYMHDTPDRHYFERDMRALSSGCIRLERPFDLVEFVLRQNTNWTREAIEAADAEPDTKLVGVRRPIPVHLEYRTVLVGGDGTVRFREDVYGLDRIFHKGYVERAAAIAEAAKSIF